MTPQLSEIAYALCVLFQLFLMLAGGWAIVVFIVVLIVDVEGIPSLLDAIRNLKRP